MISCVHTKTMNELSLKYIKYRMTVFVDGKFESLIIVIRVLAAHVVK